MITLILGLIIGGVIGYAVGVNHKGSIMTNLRVELAKLEERIKAESDKID